jgi:hypothetical protein
MIVVELTCAVTVGGTLQTFYVSTDAYTTGASDTPANSSFLPTLKDPGSIGVNVFGDGFIAGATKLDTGEIVLTNANGQYDDWINYGFGGRPVVIRQGKVGAAYPAGFTTIFTGTVVNVFANRKEIRVRVRDKQAVFDKPVLTTTYAGTNSLPNGAEGTTDIKGNVKPRSYGAPNYVAPVCVNTSKLTYQCSDGALQDITAVYDRGTSLTKGADFANLALLEAATPAASTYVTCLALGLFRLGSTPAGQVTCDPLQGAASANRTVAQVLKALALAAGVASGEIDAASVTALDAINSNTVGLYLDDDTTFADAMDGVAQSIGAYYGFDPAGMFVMGQWQAPSGTSLATIGEFYAGQETERTPLRDVNIPIYQAKVNHTQVFSVQSDLAGSVSATLKAKVAQEFRTEVATDASIQTQFLDAPIFEIDTLLTSTSDAQAEATRLLTLHKVRRDAFQVPIPFDLIGSAGLKLGTCVTLQITRFGLSGGKLMRISGVRLELAKSRAWLTVWG